MKFVAVEGGKPGNPEEKKKFKPHVDAAESRLHWWETVFSKSKGKMKMNGKKSGMESLSNDKETLGQVLLHQFKQLSECTPLPNEQKKILYIFLHNR